MSVDVILREADLEPMSVDVTPRHVDTVPLPLDIVLPQTSSEPN